MHALGRAEEALASYDQALSRQPDHLDALANRGATLRSLGRLAAALASYDRALALCPDHPGAHFNRALLLLQTGNFRDGWREYEWRRQTGAGFVAKARKGGRRNSPGGPGWYKGAIGCGLS